MFDEKRIWRLGVAWSSKQYNLQGLALYLIFSNWHQLHSALPFYTGGSQCAAYQIIFDLWPPIYQRHHYSKITLDWPCCHGPFLQHKDFAHISKIPMCCCNLILPFIHCQIRIYHKQTRYWLVFQQCTPYMFKGYKACTNFNCVVYYTIEKENALKKSLNLPLLQQQNTRSLCCWQPTSKPCWLTRIFGEHQT